MSKDEEFVPNALVLSMANTPSIPGSIRFSLDMHTWNQDEIDCPIKSSDGLYTVHKHFMKCGVCGIRRYGAFAEHGAYHYFSYDQQDGIRSEYVPPCAALPEPTFGVVDEFVDRSGVKVRFCRALNFLEMCRYLHGKDC